MANGSPRSTATQTVPPVYIKTPSLLWSEHSKAGYPDYARPADENNLQGDIDQAAIKKKRSHSRATSNKAARSPPRLNGHDQGQFILGDDSASMLGSPAGSCQGSTNHEKTPRIRPVDSVRSSPPLLILNNNNNNSPPNKQDSAYESIKGISDEESKVDIEVQARNIRARERVEICRGRALRTRRILNETRQNVQILREKLRDATATLMKAIDELMARDNAQNLQSLNPYYQATRAAQDELGPAEDAYDILEIRLNREEEELEQEEMHFYTHNNITLRPLPDTKLDAPLTPLVKPYQPDDAQFQNLDLENELVKQYLGKVTEAEHLKEEIDELENEQYILTEELTFRTRYNLKLSEEKTAFMFEYPQLYKKLVENLQRVEDELYELRDHCIDQGLFTDSQYTYEPRDAFVEEIYESVNDALDRSPLRIAAEHAPSYQSHKTDYEDKRDYVNTWMLEWVQDSPVEALRLKTIIVLEFEKDGKELEGDKWPSLAIGWWDKDHAGEDAEEKRVQSTMDARLGNTTEGSLDVDLGDFGMAENEIMGSETGSYETQKGDYAIQIRVDEEPKQTRTQQGLVLRNRTSSVSRAISI